MVFIAVVLMTLWAVMSWPRMYQSQARLLVHFAGDAGAADTSPATATSSLDPARAQSVELLVQEFNDSQVLGRVFESTGLDGPSKTSSAHEQALRQLRARALIASPPGSNVIEVHCRAASPAAAQRLTSRLVAICLDHGGKASAAAALAAQRAEEQRAEESRRLKAKADEEAARQASERASAAAAAKDAKRQALEGRIGKTDAELAGVRAELQAADERIASLDEQIASLPPEQPEPQTSPAPSASESPPQVAAGDGAPKDTRKTLLELEALERELAATRADNHPQLVAVRQQLADLRKSLAQEAPAPPAETKPLTQSGEPAGPSREALVKDRQTERSRAAVLRSRENELAATTEKLRSESAQHEKKEPALASSTPVAELPQSQPADEPAVEAKPVNVAAKPGELVEHRIGRLSVLQAATLPTAPVGPLPSRTLALGLGLAATSGLAAALWAARRTKIVTTARDVERLWDLPLVGMVPRMELVAGTPS